MVRKSDEVLVGAGVVEADFLDEFYSKLASEHRAVVLDNSEMMLNVSVGGKRFFKVKGGLLSLEAIGESGEILLSSYKERCVAQSFKLFRPLLAGGINSVGVICFDRYGETILFTKALVDKESDLLVKVDFEGGVFLEDRSGGTIVFPSTFESVKSVMDVCRVVHDEILAVGNLAG